MTDDKQKYVVAKGVSFIGNKKHYKEGDSIDETAFKDPKLFEKMKTGKNPRIVLAPPEEKKDDDDDVTGIDDSNIKLDRGALEKLFIEAKIYDAEKVSKIPEEKLRKLAIKKGLIKE
jgi:hypothetical protein